MVPPKLVINEPSPIHGGRNDQSSKPPIIGITQSTSQPTDPDAPSFLTTLPAEIRNAIYKILFKRDRPIEILHQMFRDLPCNDVDWYSEEEEAELDTAAIVRHNLHIGINLLKTCRQIYWEAARILYSGNAFCVTVAEHRHSYDALYVETAAAFIQSIGTQIFLISELSIDLTRLCPFECRGDPAMDILPLVRTLWSRPSIVSRVSFTTGTYDLGFKLHSEREYDSNKDIGTTRINEIFRALCTTDQAVLQRCARFERLLLVIEIEPHTELQEQEQALVFFRGGRHGCWCADLNINELDGNATLSFDSERSLTKLPYPLYDRIIEYALSPCHNIEFNFHSYTFTGLERTILQLNRQTHSLAQRYLEKSSQFTLRMRTSESETSFNDFRRLRKWWEGPYGLTLKGTYDRKDPVRWHAPKILLCFDSPNASLASLRINVKNLIRATYLMNKNTTVRISQHSENASKSTEELYEIDIQTLRRRCFILLSAMLLSKPAYAKYPAPEI